jgi:hypothetical protein
VTAIRALGDPVRALESLDRAPRQFYALGVRSEVLAVLGLLEEAEASIREAVASYPQYGDNLVQAGMTLDRLDSDEALSAVRDEPSPRGAWSTIADDDHQALLFEQLPASRHVKHPYVAA